MATDKIQIEKKPYEALSKVFIIKDNEEYSCTLDLSPLPTITLIAVFKKADKPGPVTWVWGQNNTLTLTFEGWANTLGMMASADRTQVGTVTMNNTNYSILFDVAVHHVGNGNLVHMFFYLEAKAMQ
jgi:hypothetical protein